MEILIIQRKSHDLSLEIKITRCPCYCHSLPFRKRM